MRAEQWRPVPDHDGYEASTHGRIRGRRGNLTGTAYRGGYRYVHIYLDGERVHRAVHRLVLLAFRGQPRPGEECRHLDGDPANNALTNLCWGTHQQNNQDRVRHGTHHQASKTECVNGHTFTTENTYRPPRGGRQCRACATARKRASRAD